MSISPSTDIVLEVSRAADPARAAAVTAKLDALSNQAAAASPKDFAAALDATAPAPAAEGATDMRGKLTNASLGGAQRAEKAKHKLESVVLSEFIGEMLPKDTPSAYGQGFAGDMWRQMLAERVADQIAASGRFPLAARMFADKAASATAHLTGGAQSHDLQQANAVLSSRNALSAPSGAAINEGAVLFARTKPL